MYADDHNPPHFHALCNNRQCIVDIRKAKAKGNLSKREKKLIVAWAEIHKEELLKNWDLLLNEGRVESIAPLS